MKLHKLTADCIFDGFEFYDSNTVLVYKENGEIEALINKLDAGEQIQHVEGLVMPGLVNSHCHIELSYLQQKIKPKTGLIPFLLAVINQRNADKASIAEHIAIQDEWMFNHGINVVGDICNTSHSLDVKLQSKIHYHNFIEVAGFIPNTAEARFNDALQVYHAFKQHFPNQTSIVPHAPYSVSANLLKLIQEENNCQISTTHFLESQAEIEFFKYKTGDFLSLYTQLGIDIDFFKPEATTSLAYVYQYFTKNKSNLFVHNTFISPQEVAWISAHIPRAYFCLCPNANLYIENKLPNKCLIELNTPTFVIGTDSLASNNSLHILNELNTILNHYPQANAKHLLQAVTSTGAAALGVSGQYGSFQHGKKPGIINVFVNSLQNLLSPNISNILYSNLKFNNLVKRIL